MAKPTHAMCESCGKVLPWNYDLMGQHAAICYKNNPSKWNGWRTIHWEDVIKKLKMAAEEELNEEIEGKK